MMFYKKRTMKKINGDSIVYVFARIFSTVLSPLLMPTMGIFIALWATVLCYIPAGTRLVVMLVVFGITCIMPMVAIAVLHNLKIIEDKRLVKREERWLPYIATVLCYICSAIYLHHIHTPQWVVMFMVGGAVACIISTVVTLWWKISAHMAGIGGLLALVVHIHIDGYNVMDMKPLIALVVLLAGCLGSSRIFMGRHTLWQVLMGFANGFLMVYLTCTLFS